MKPILFIMLLALGRLDTPVADSKSPEEKPREPAASEAKASPPLKQIAPGVFEVGQVRFTTRDRQVRFPAFVNMEGGLLEYLVVTGTGKLHESLLRTEVEPYHIHVAMLFLGAKGSTAEPMSPNAFAGENVTIEIVWKENGKEKKSAIESFVTDLSSREPLRRGPWIYNGSRIIEGTFLAQRNGSIIALIEDPDALMNNPVAGREDDENWEARKIGPGFDTPIEVLLTLAAPKKK
jgi:hypothetical protein